MMEQTQKLRDRAREDGNAIALAKAGCLIAGIAAVVVVTDLFALGELGLVLGLIGAGLAAPFGIGKRWFWALAGGAVLAVIAWIISDSNQTTGGALAVIAALAMVVGACLGYPSEEE